MNNSYKEIRFVLHYFFQRLKNFEFENEKMHHIFKKLKTI